MLKERTIEDHIKSAKREYKQTLKDLSLIIQSELSVVDDREFVPSAIDAYAFHLIQHANQLRSLMGVNHG